MKNSLTALTITAHKTAIVLNPVYLAACLCLALTASIVSSSIMAGESYSNALTHDMNYYNPLRHNDGRIGSKNIYPNTALSNSELNRVAEDIRSENMTTEQRALNHQWLQHGYSDHGIRLGSKVISKLFKMGFRTYWDGVRNKHYKYSTAVPDGSGNGKVTQDVDYKLRLSDNRVKIAINYDF